MTDQELMAYVKDLNNWQECNREGNKRTLQMGFKGITVYEGQELKDCTWRHRRYWRFTPAGIRIILRSRVDIVDQMRLAEATYRKK